MNVLCFTFQHRGTLGTSDPSRPAWRAACRSACVVLAALTTPPAASAQNATMSPPISLREVLDSVRAGHPAIQASRARVRAAEGSRLSAGALGNPVLSYQVENAPLSGHAAPLMHREAMTTAMLPLEALYQRPFRTRQAGAAARAARAELTAESQGTGLDAVHAYYRAALAQVGVDVASDLAAWLDSLVAYNRTRVEEGIAAAADLVRSRLERDRATAEYTLAQVELARARAGLLSFLGDTPSALTAPRVVVDSMPLTMPSVSARVAATPSALASDTGVRQATAFALRQRADLVAARERVAAAQAGMATERAMSVRQVGAMFGTKRSAGTTSMVAGFSLPLPLFDQNRGEVRRAAAEADVARFELEARERTVRADVGAAYTSVRTLTESVEAFVTTDSSTRARVGAGMPGYLARANEARRIALGAYREGAVSLLQVLDAARAWGDARRIFFQTLFAQHESVFELLVAEGHDLWSALSRPAPGGGGESSPSRTISLGRRP